MASFFALYGHLSVSIQIHIYIQKILLLLLPRCGSQYELFLLLFLLLCTVIAVPNCTNHVLKTKMYCKDIVHGMHGQRLWGGWCTVEAVHGVEVQQNCTITGRRLQEVVYCMTKKKRTRQLGVLYQLTFTIKSSCIDVGIVYFVLCILSISQ